MFSYKIVEKVVINVQLSNNNVLNFNIDLPEIEDTMTKEKQKQNALETFIKAFKLEGIIQYNNRWYNWSCVLAVWI